jgi:hypothetical protein
LYISSTLIGETAEFRKKLPGVAGSCRELPGVAGSCRGVKVSRETYLFAIWENLVHKGVRLA